jgi:uncharacterized membrane protein
MFAVNLRFAMKINRLTGVFRSWQWRAAGAAALLAAALLGGPHSHGLASKRFDIVLVALAAGFHAFLYGALALWFGGSLRPGREPVVTMLARRVEPCVTPALVRYTRGVTWLWTGFFVGQLLLSALLLGLAPLAVWSFFVTVLDLPLVVLTFAGEYAVRRRMLRHQRLASLAETVLAFGRAGFARR